MSTINLDEEIFALKCDIDLRIMQLQRLKQESIRNSSRQSNGLTTSDVPKESIFSSNNYGLSTLSEVKPEPRQPTITTRRTRDTGDSNLRGSVGGPKVKTKKPYCTLI